MTLALIAGQGALPVEVSRRLRAADTPHLVCAMSGFAPDLRAELTFRIEHLGSFVAGLKARGVDAVCLAGAVRRPPIDPEAIDAATAPLVPRILAALEAGDDGALRAVMETFEEAGITVRAAHEIAPDLLPPPGVPTRRKPDDAHARAVLRAAEVHLTISAADIGQAVVVAGGQVVAVEAAPGTDWTLATLAGADGPARGGVLYKAPKAGQDRRADLPVIGPATVEGAAEARLAGIVIEAGGVMVLDAEATVAAADARDLFIWVRAP